MTWLVRCWHWFLYLPKLQVRLCLRVLERYGMFWFYWILGACFSPGVFIYRLVPEVAEWIERLNPPPGTMGAFVVFVILFVSSQFGIPLMLTGSLFVKLLFKLEPGPSGEENRRKAVEKLKVWSQS